jgi:hypothetical protein
MPLVEFFAGQEHPNFNTAYRSLWIHEFHDSERRLRVLSSATDATQLAQDSETGRILFLRGLPSPKWVAQLGGRLQLDPQIWKTHLSYLKPRHTSGRQTSSHSAEIAARSSISIPIASIGKRVDMHAGTKQTMEKERAAAAERMGSYFDTLSSDNVFNSDSGWRVGDSVVRDFRLLDEEWFTISQMCTIHLSLDIAQPRSWTCK